MITVSMFQSMMAASLAQMQPQADQDSIFRAMKANPDNVRFLMENEAPLKEKRAALEAELKAVGIDGN